MQRIFIVNQGYPWYLPIVCKQAESFNGRGSVTLILDEYPHESCGYNVVLMKEHTQMADRFARVYRSFFSATDWHKFELIWFQRFMFVLEYLESLNHEGGFWIFDSDVLLFANLDTVKIHAWARFTRNKEQDPCFLWFAETAILREFCEFILDGYENRLAEIAKHYRVNYVDTGAAGGICEMTFLKWFADARIHECQDLTVPVDGLAFDRGIQIGDGYKTNLLNAKKVYWKGHLPWGSLGGLRTQFYGLHCQGEFKNLIPLYRSGPKNLPMILRTVLPWLLRSYLTTGTKTLIKKILGRA